MAEGNTLEFTDDNFTTDVLESDQPVLVDFWAEWCPPCRALTPTINELADEYAGKVKIGKLNIDEHPQTPTKYGIASIPTLLLFKNGEVAEKIVGQRGKADLKEAIEGVAV